MHKEITPQVEEDEQVPQGAKGDQVTIRGQGNDVPLFPRELSYRDIREAFLVLARALTTKVNLSMVPRVNFVESTMTFSLTESVRMNTPIFLGFKVG